MTTPPIGLPLTDETANSVWSRYQNDFDAMSDAEIASESRDEQAKLEEAEDWLEAVAAWEAAGRPRTTKGEA